MTTSAMIERNETPVAETGFVRITDLMPAVDAFNAACEAARECDTSETRRQVDRTCFALLLELQSAGMSDAYWDFVSLDRGIVRFAGAIVPRSTVASEQ